jgi:hypothetical protein
MVSVCAINRMQNQLSIRLAAAVAAKEDNKTCLRWLPHPTTMTKELYLPICKCESICSLAKVRSRHRRTKRFQAEVFFATGRPLTVALEEDGKEIMRTQHSMGDRRINKKDEGEQVAALLQALLHQQDVFLLITLITLTAL